MPNRVLRSLRGVINTQPVDCCAAMTDHDAPSVPFAGYGLAVS